MLVYQLFQKLIDFLLDLIRGEREREIKKVLATPTNLENAEEKFDRITKLYFPKEET